MYLFCSRRRGTFVETRRLQILPTLHRHLLHPSPSLPKGGIQPPFLTQERFTSLTVFAAGNTKSCKQHTPTTVPRPPTRVQSFSRAVEPYSAHIWVTCPPSPSEHRWESSVIRYVGIPPHTPPQGESDPPPTSSWQYCYLLWIWALWDFMIGPHCVVQVIPASSSHLQHLFFFFKENIQASRST